jgi:hypothetical protein
MFRPQRRFLDSRPQMTAPVKQSKVTSTAPAPLSGLDARRADCRESQGHVNRYPTRNRVARSRLCRGGTAEPWFPARFNVISVAWFGFLGSKTSVTL